MQLGGLDLATPTYHRGCRRQDSSEDPPRPRCEGGDRLAPRLPHQTRQESVMMYAACSVRDIPVAGQRLCGLTWMGQVLWFSDAALEQIFAVDPHNGLVVHKIDCPGVRTGLTTVGGNLLQVVGPERRLRTIDPETGETVDEVANPRLEA